MIERWMPTLSCRGFRSRRWLPLVAIAAVLVIPALRAGATPAPTNLTLPTVSGTPYVGKTLTSTAGTWSGTPTPTYTYQWQRCTVSTGACSNATGAPKGTYALGSPDKGKQIRLRATAKNAAGPKVVFSAQTVATTQPIAPRRTGP